MFSVGSSSQFNINIPGNVHGANIYQNSYQVCDNSGNCGSSSGGAFAYGTGISTGAIIAGNTTEDLLIGGTSTGSATIDLSALGATTGTQASISANFLTTGSGLSLTSNSNNLTTGNLFNLNYTGNAAFTSAISTMSWNPTVSTTATGDLLDLNVGANGTLANIFNVMNNGSSVFSVSQTQITGNLPVQFTAPGSASFANDINFTNPTSSFITSHTYVHLCRRKYLTRAI